MNKRPKKHARSNLDELPPNPKKRVEFVRARDFEMIY